MSWHWWGMAAYMIVIVLLMIGLKRFFGNIHDPDDEE